jgi:hypothetical protein
MNKKVSLATMFWMNTCIFVNFLANLLINLGIYIVYTVDIPFCVIMNLKQQVFAAHIQARRVIMNLKRQLCAAQRRVARPQATGIKLYSFINFSAVLEQVKILMYGLFTTLILVRLSL